MLTVSPHARVHRRNPKTGPRRCGLTLPASRSRHFRKSRNGRRRSTVPSVQPPMPPDIRPPVGAISRFDMGDNRVVTDTTSQFYEQAAMDESTGVVQIEGLTLNPATGEALLDGQLLGLTKTEFGILLFLMQSDGQTFARKEIIEAVQGGDYPATDHSVDGHVMSLRRKLGSRSRLIETVRGTGYRRRTL
jgi:DNA-binding response OmpR family regulator